jgi:formate dehydrogenase major subunit
MGKTRPSAHGTRGCKRRALAKVKWLVVRDLTEIETATFWRDSPKVLSEELRTEDIETEVFLMRRPPTSRRRDLSPTAPSARPRVARAPCPATADSTRERDWPIRNLSWDYPERGARRRTRC